MQLATWWQACLRRASVLSRCMETTGCQSAVCACRCGQHIARRSSAVCHHVWQEPGRAGLALRAEQRRGKARCRQQLLQEQPPQREQGRRLCLPGPQVPVAGQGLCREYCLLLATLSEPVCSRELFLFWNLFFWIPCAAAVEPLRVLTLSWLMVICLASRQLCSVPMSLRLRRIPTLWTELWSWARTARALRLPPSSSSTSLSSSTTS